MIHSARPAPCALRLACAVAASVLLAGPAPAAGAPSSQDAYIAGYAEAVLERELALPRARVLVQDGVVTVEADALRGEERDTLVKVLGAIEGVERVEIVEPGAIPERDGTGTQRATGGDLPRVRTGAAGAAREVEADGPILLPERELFTPLLADPRWPHFGGTYQRYLGDEELENVTAVSFGESMPLLGGSAFADGRWELGLQAGVFSLFDLDTSSFDLLNSDFLAGITSSYRRGDFSMIARVLHQSSHLGDELLLREPVERINLSFEEVGLLLSHDFLGALRLYGGGSYLVRRDPDELDPGSFQAGLELIAPHPVLHPALRPLAAVDVQVREESDWSPDVSARAGFQLQSERLLGSRLQLLIEYYDGRSPNGQFFERDIEYIGLGAHLHL